MYSYSLYLNSLSSRIFSEFSILLLSLFDSSLTTTLLSLGGVFSPVSRGSTDARLNTSSWAVSAKFMFMASTALPPSTFFYPATIASVKLPSRESSLDRISSFLIFSSTFISFCMVGPSFLSSVFRLPSPAAGSCFFGGFGFAAQQPKHPNVPLFLALSPYELSPSPCFFSFSVI